MTTAKILLAGAEVLSDFHSRFGSISTMLTSRHGGGGRRDRQTFLTGDHHHDLHRHPRQHRAGWLGGFVVGAIAAALTYGVGQLLLAFVRPLWLRIGIALAFVAPAALAGYHATHGIVKHTMPSETWQIVFSVIGAIAVGVTALLKMTTMATPGSPGGSVAHG